MAPVRRAATEKRLALLLTAAAFAQNYPSKPVRFMVGFAAGGAADIIRMSVSEG